MSSGELGDLPEGMRRLGNRTCRALGNVDAADLNELVRTDRDLALRIGPPVGLRRQDEDGRTRYRHRPAIPGGASGGDNKVRRLGLGTDGTALEGAFCVMGR